MSERLPELLDNAALRRELGIKEWAATKIMEALPVVRFPNLDRVYVKRDDVARYLEEDTIKVKR